MRNKTLLIAQIALTLLISINSFSQETEKPINYRYKGGEIGFREYLANRIKFPEEAIENGVIGFSISSITVSPQATIEDISIINPIDPSIDNEVKRLLKSSKKYWVESDTSTSNQTFYIQIIFTCSGSGLEIDSEIYVKSNPNFIEPIAIAAIPLNGGKSIPSSNSLSKKCTELMNQGKYEEALPIINNLIRRHPYIQSLYQIRIDLYNNTNRKELISNDIQKIESFIPGKSLEELIQN